MPTGLLRSVLYVTLLVLVFYALLLVFGLLPTILLAVALIVLVGPRYRRR